MFRFLDRGKINYENVIDEGLPVKRTFYLKNKSELPFLGAFQHKVLRLISLSEMEELTVTEDLLENGEYAMSIYSNSEDYAERMEEYLKFMYDS